jgi:Protein of unknown function (DUF1641)
MNDSAVSSQPLEAVTERLNDPAVAASVVTLLNHAELLSTLVTGLSGFFERGDVIMNSLATEVAEMRKAQRSNPSSFDVTGAVATAKTLAGNVNDAMPTLNRLLASGMLNDKVLDVLSMVGDAAVEGAANARRNKTSVHGVMGVAKSLRDPDVQKGLGLLIEVARSLGTRL